MRIRAANEADADAIRAVHRRAFPTALEAGLVERLIVDGDAAVSLVADQDGIVGHVLLSRMTVTADGKPVDALALAPLAVIPERQGQGIGSALVEAAVQSARTARTQMLFLLGEPRFYGRFGFRAATAQPFDSPFAGPYFQALALADVPAVRHGLACYPSALEELG